MTVVMVAGPILNSTWFVLPREVGSLTSLFFLVFGQGILESVSFWLFLAFFCYFSFKFSN